MSEQDVPLKLFQVGQKAFIDKDGEVLIVFRTNGYLDFPGGRINEGETDIVAALKREVREETTLEVEIGRPFVVGLARADTAYLVGFRCRYLSGEVRLSGEHRAFRWVDRTSFEALADGSGAFAMLRAYFETNVP